ncbi:hypothetical protein AR158_C606R [Paramecium bursaria Chlorella virus AR158]|uniref:hypothetical protein n=1 Tax=Paramecium bursaria Chlorella virus AR158 TaxID=380598 RepID=UPI00015AA7C7|nr:hypothetical protein AR158_C606R [Paramecium bursaria Chlorella virus AR158]ABU44151.1 hypothetical protein AR158_C606R [Paramecium bursaria Chlorella virus AR158]
MNRNYLFPFRYSVLVGTFEWLCFYDTHCGNNCFVIFITYQNYTTCNIFDIFALRFSNWQKNHRVVDRCPDVLRFIFILYYLISAPSIY